MKIRLIEFNPILVRLVSRATFLFGLLWLSACASTPPPPPPQSSTPPPERQQKQSQAQAKEQQQEQQTEATESKSQANSQPPAGSSSPSSSADQDQPPPSSAAAGSPPPSGGAGEQDQSEGSPAASAGAPTRGERGKELDGEFQRSLGEFDDRLAREQGELESLGDAQASAEQRRASQDGDPAGVNDGRIGRASAPPPPLADGERPDDAANRRGPGSPGDRASLPPTPDNVPSGQNDDVVARQLREAAESEPDPQLREKLWEEYRQYKRNNG